MPRCAPPPHTLKFGVFFFLHVFACALHIRVVVIAFFAGRVWNAIRIWSTTHPKEHRDHRVGYDDDDDGNYSVIAVFVELYKSSDLL